MPDGAFLVRVSNKRRYCYFDLAVLYFVDMKEELYACLTLLFW